MLILETTKGDFFMIKWLLDEFLLILLLNIPYDCVKFISYASYRNNHRKEVKFWPKIKIPMTLDIKKMGISTEKGMGKITRQENARKFGKIDRWPLTMRSIDWGTNRPVRRGWEFKWPLPPRTLHFSHFLIQSLPPLHILASRGYFGLVFGLIEGLDSFFGTDLS